MVVSDGSHMQQAMLATQLNDLVKQNLITRHCFIKLTDFICNEVQNRKCAPPLHCGYLGRACILKC